MDKYEFVKDIGAGSFGSAKLMMNKETKQLVAVKFIKRGPEINENVVREIINHRSTMHPNIVRFIELLLTPTHLLIVMEYAAGGELYDRVRNAGRFSEDEARYFFQQLISGVSYCHSMIQSLEKVTAAPSRALKPTTMIFLQRLRYLVNLLAKQISHGDLKLANTLLDGSPAPRLKICDFGYSVSSVLHSKPKSIAGTLQYVAPEVLSGTEYDGKLADVWSCGVTLYVMLVGAYPFEDEKDPKKIEKTTQCILGARYEIPAYIHISEECRHLLSHMFVAPARRITIQEIKNHPWFLKNLPREPTAAAQAMYYSKTNPTFLIQTLDEIMEIVDEAKKPATCPPFDSNLIGGFRWAKEESDNDQEENVDLEMGEEEVKEEDEYEVSKENGYDKKVEVCEDKRVKEFCKLKSLSVSDAVRSAERSQVLNQFHSDHTDPSPVAATSVDQSMFGLRLPERSLGTNQMHSYHSDSAVSQSVAYAKKGKNSNQMDSSMYVRLAERSIESNALHFHHSHPSASQSISFAGNPRNSKLSYSSICNVRSSEKSIKSNVSHPSEPSESQMQSPDSASELSDTKSWEKVASFDPSMSDVREAEKSIVLKQLHSYQNSSASKLCAPCLPEGSIDSIVLDSDYSAQIGNLDLSISDVRSAEKSIVSSFHFDWRG